jgi:hypothetical protein
MPCSTPMPSIARPRSSRTWHLRMLPIVCLFVCASCTRAQETGTAAADSTARVAASEEARRDSLRIDLSADVAAVAAEIARLERDDVSEHLIASEHAAFAALAITARALDNTGMYTDEILAEQRKLTEETSGTINRARRITNGMVSLYTLYGIVYKMRFNDDDERMRVLEEMNGRVVGSLKSSKVAIEPVALMAESVYMLARDIMRTIDRDSLYREAFLTIEAQYLSGRTAAETEEERYISGMYRVFEISQLWALFIDPTLRERISALNKELAGHVTSTLEVGEQMAWATEYVARINEMIARATITNNFQPRTE